MFLVLLISISHESKNRLKMKKNKIRINLPTELNFILFIKFIHFIFHGLDTVPIKESIIFTFYLINKKKFVNY